jgi:DNA-binding NarL/FixJ family response regulator
MVVRDNPVKVSPVSAVKVAIVEDSTEVRESWAGLLKSTPGMSCICACDSAEVALVELPPLRPEVVLMDLNLPGMSGTDCTRQLRALLPDTQILVVTAYGDNQRVFQALQAGANGYLLKRTSSQELLAAITEVAHGGAPMTGEIARRVLEAFRQPPAATDKVELSPRELEILQLVAKGYTNKEVAERLDLSFETVRTRLKHIYEKLHVRSRAGATSKYLQSVGVLGAAPGLQD